MPGIFEHYMILSDLDGTLFDENQKVLKKDVEAIRRFTAEGGTFGVSTGRVMVSARKLIAQLPVNSPCVFANGGVIMDPRTGRFQYKSLLPPSAREALARIIAAFPNLRAAVLMGDVYYNVTEKKDGEQPFLTDVPTTSAIALEDLPDGWYKILMNIMDHPMEEVQAFCAGMDYPDLNFVATTSFYYEILPMGNTKAKGNRMMQELMGWQKKTLIAVGDYFNDLEMIADADLGVAVGAAPLEVKKAADLVVCDMHEGAMADLVRRLTDREAL